MAGRAAEVQIEGLRKVARDISYLKDKGLKQELRGLNRKAGELVKHASDPPVLTGRLKASLAVRPGLQFTSVKAGGARVPYAAPIHWGWARHNIKPNPFISRGIRRTRGAMTAVYRNGMANLAKKISARRGR